MTARSSILAWTSPQTEEPDRLQPMRSQSRTGLSWTITHTRSGLLHSAVSHRQLWDRYKSQWASALLSGYVERFSRPSFGYLISDLPVKFQASPLSPPICSKLCYSLSLPEPLVSPIPLPPKLRLYWQHSWMWGFPPPAQAKWALWQRSLVAPVLQSPLHFCWDSPCG